MNTTERIGWDNSCNKGIKFTVESSYNGQWHRLFIAEVFIGYVEKYDRSYWRFAPVIGGPTGRFNHGQECLDWVINQITINNRLGDR